VKILTLVDSSAVKSFYVKDKKAYEMKTDLPYIRNQSIGNECFMSIFEYPFLNDGYYVTWDEWDELPSLDVDVVLLSIEKKYQLYNVNQVRKKYPNAFVLGVLKEFSSNYQNKVKFFKQCNGYTLPVMESQIHDDFTKDVGKKSNFLAQPYDVDFLYDKYYKEERLNSIFSYVVPSEWVTINYGREIQNGSRRGNTEMFANKMSDKFNLQIQRNETLFSSPTQWRDFLEMLSNHSFCFNLDFCKGGGNQAIQNAILGVINIGGNGWIQNYLYPELSGINEEHLEIKFSQIVNDMEKRNEIIKHAFDKVVTTFSLPSVYRQIKKIVGV
tara:strand:+ start:835 stop:1815 length:981 start_codon:yes stop_codon:yes gene_type:complete